MAKVIKYVGAYLMWLTDLGLTFWLAFISRTVFLGIFALSYEGGQSVYAEVVYAHRVDFADKIFSIALGLGWLVFMIAVEAHFRAGAARDDLLVRFARVTGPVLLGIFLVDLILFWLQGGGDLLRWFILAAELGIGIALLVSARPQPKPNPI
jgi:hypothetical protein